MINPERRRENLMKIEEMDKREKVIKGLEQFKSDFKPFCGNIADWKRVDDALALLKDEKEYCDKCAESAIKTTVELQEEIARLRSLLKEQEAVEPKKENDREPEPWTVWWYVCGDCGQPIDKMDRYCRRCGKRVKWE